MEEKRLLNRGVKQSQLYDNYRTSKSSAQTRSLQFCCLWETSIPTQLQHHPRAQQHCCTLIIIIPFLDSPETSLRDPAHQVRLQGEWGSIFNLQAPERGITILGGCNSWQTGDQYSIYLSDKIKKHIYKHTNFYNVTNIGNKKSVTTMGRFRPVTDCSSLSIKIDFYKYKI